MIAMGFDAATVDAGYEWVGFHASGAGNAAPRTYNMMWYDDWIASTRPCAMVLSSPVEIDGFPLLAVERSAYRQYLFAGSVEPLYLYGTEAAGCPPLPSAAPERAD